MQGNVLYYVNRQIIIIYTVENNVNSNYFATQTLFRGQADIFCFKKIEKKSCLIPIKIHSLITLCLNIPMKPKTHQNRIRIILGQSINVFK